MPHPGSSKRYPFRGGTATAREIASATGLKLCSVYTRLRQGNPLDSDKRIEARPRMDPIEPPMRDDSVRYEHDIECRVARLVCGGECEQEQIARCWDVSHQYIEQLEKSALKKLRAQARWCREARALVEMLSDMRRETYAERTERFAQPITRRTQRKAS
jgi:hypothetical protein